MQNFRGVPDVTPQIDEAAFGKVDIQGTGLVDMQADALRVMGKSERDIQQLLKELVAPFPQPYSHNADVPVVGSTVTVPNMREALHVPDVKGAGFVDRHELVVAMLEMGKSERDIQQLLGTVSLSTKSLSRHSLNRFFTTSTCRWSVREVKCRTCERHMMSQFVASSRRVLTHVTLCEKKSIQPTRNRLLTFPEVLAPKRWSLCICRKFVVQDIPKTLRSDSAGTSVLARCTVPLAPQRSLPLQAPRGSKKSRHWGGGDQG